MKHTCDFCSKEFSSGYRCVNCGTYLCQGCVDKKYNFASLIRLPFSVATLGAVDVKKRQCLKCKGKVVEISS
jgi:hypothetical protein